MACINKKGVDGGTGKKYLTEQFCKISILQTVSAGLQNLNMELICTFFQMFCNKYVAIAIIMHIASQIGGQEQI